MAAEDESKELNLDHPLSIHGSRAPQPTRITAAQDPLPLSTPLLPIAMAMISAQVQPHVFHQEDTPWNLDPAEHQAPGVVQPQPHRHASHQQQIGQTQTQQTQQHNTAPSSLQHSSLQGGGDEHPHQPQHSQMPLEHLDLTEADTQFDQVPSRPRRLLNSVSKSLPVLLAVVVAYIYYVYTVRVCITYLIMDQKQPLQGGLYLAAFNVLILLFAVSYYQSIFTSPGSPSNPPSLRNPSPSIPPTTTPYQSQSPGPTRSGSDDRVSSHASVASPSLSPPSRLAHQSSSVAPIGPRYLNSVSSSTALTFPPSSDSAEHKDDHVIDIPPDNTSTHGHRLSVDFSVSPGGLTGSILGHGSARSRVHIEDDSLQRPVATLSVCKRDGRSRWCEICKIVKPDRCHHCSECNICVLRMDHHCPWVNGCVGFGNYKQFYLFILYGSLSAVWVVGSMIPLLVKALESHAHDQDGWKKGNWTNGNSAYSNHTWSSQELSNGTWTKDEDHSTSEAIRAFDIQWVIITVVTFLLALLIASFTVVHTRYILSNQTTIESLQDVRNMHVKVQYRKREPTPQPHSNSVNVNANGGGGGVDGVAGLPPFMSEINHNIVIVEQGERLWDQGSWLANWKSVMGPTWWLWFVPYWNSQGDGIHDIYNANVYKRLLADALAQARMQAVNFGVVRDLTGEELTGPVAPGLGPGSGPSSPPHSPSSPTRSKNGTFSSQTRVPVGLSSGSGSTSPGGTGSTRKRIATAPPMLMPSIRMQYDGSEASGSRDPGLQLRQGVASSIDSQAGQADVSVDDGSMVAQGHRSSSAVSTPRQNNTPRSQSPRQPRTPKSRSHESGHNVNNNNNTSRRRQRTMSGGTSVSYGFGGPIKEFGLGLGMDGIPADSGTGLKLSSGLLGRSSHGHLRSQERGGGGGGGSSQGSRQPRATQ